MNNDTIGDWINTLMIAGKSPQTIHAYNWHIGKMADAFPEQAIGQLSTRDITT